MHLGRLGFSIVQVNQVRMSICSLGTFDNIFPQLQAQPDYLSTLVQTSLHLLQKLTEMFRHSVITCFALIIAIQATAIPSSHTNVYQRDATIDDKTTTHQLSTEAIISIIGVVVAILGIASSLAWSKRRKSRGRPRQALSTPDGA
jgi:hypothetical protein